jgi:ABC-type Mn2+/Zn2+ transport system permease subunit
MSKLNLSRVPKDQIGARMTAALHGNLPLYVGELLVGLACSALGGYIAARIAKHDELLNGLLSSFLCVALGIYTMASGKDTNALWLQILLLVASPACALLGGALMRRQRQHRVQPA